MIGTANTVLVHQSDGEALAFIGTIQARAIDAETEDATRLVTYGFGSEAERHIHDVVWPLVSGLATQLGIRLGRFELQLVTPSAASLFDSDTAIDGRSFGPAAVVACVSAMLALTVAPGLLVTGRLASVAGQIAPVGHHAAKLSAAIRDPHVCRFLYGDLLDHASSAERLFPEDARTELNAISDHQDKINIQAIRGMDELLETAFTETDILVGMFRHDIDVATTRPDSGSPLGRSVALFGCDRESRLHNELERLLFNGESNEAKTLLSVVVEHYLKRRSYPRLIGRRLKNLTASLPSHVRRLRSLFPLVEMDMALQLVRYADTNATDDAMEFLDAVRGTKARDQKDNNTPREFSPTGLLDSITAQLCNAALASEITGPLNEARSTFLLTEVTCETEMELYAAIQQFYAHLLTHSDRAMPLDENQTHNDSLLLLDRSYQRYGGRAVAIEQARSGTDGGLRTVLDRMVDQLIYERTDSHRKAVLTEQLCDLTYDDRLAFAAELVARMATSLPPQYSGKDIRDLAGQTHSLIEAYVEMVNRWQKQLHCL